MVHRGDTNNFSPESEQPWLKTMTVKAEIGDLFVEQNPLSSKRPKLDFSYKHNPLEQPRPLGLKLKKSPSFLDLIQMRLSQEKSVSLAKSLPRKEKEHKSSGIGDKLKASNFPATILKIGTWEYKSRYEGDLVAKCYFAKHKLVWEVLDGGLKNKIEIQWSDIVAIKGNYPDDGPGTLDVVLARHPLFFREINPQPRKHTLWQATSDFTGEQATVYRRHFLQCSPGLLGKHFEKLIQCDPRLNFLSQQPEIVLDNPYFEHRVATFCDPNESECAFKLKTESDSIIFSLGDTPSASGACLSSSQIEHSELVSTSAEHNSLGKTSTSLEICVLDGNAKRTKDANGVKLMDQIKLPGLRASMSMSDFVNHIGQCISEQMTSSNPSPSIDDDQRSNIFEEIAHYLLSDSQTSVSDENSIMSRVNSLCCLLQMDPISAIQNCQVKSNDASNVPGAETRGIKPLAALSGYAAGLVPADEDESRNGNGCKQDSSMTRADSVGELLLELPRIASMPQFLSNMSEDYMNRAR